MGEKTASNLKSKSTLGFGSQQENILGFGTWQKLADGQWSGAVPQLHSEMNATDSPSAPTSREEKKLSSVGSFLFIHITLLTWANIFQI